MNIVIAAEAQPVEASGLATYTNHLVRGLLEAGHSLKIICYGYKRVERRKKVGIPGVDKTKLVSLRWPKYIRQMLYFIKLFFLSKGCGVIYALGPVLSGIPALWVKRVTGKQLVLRVISDEAWEKGVGWKKVGVEDDYSAFQKRTPIRVLRWIKKMQAKVVREADLVIVQSLYFRKLVCSWLGGCGAGHSDDRCVNVKLRVIYNSLNPKIPINKSKQEAQVEVGIKGDILLCVANIIPRKGIGLLVKLMPFLLKVNPRFKLVVIGQGDFLEFYRVLVQELQLEESVFLIGRVPREKMPYYYTASSLFLLNSKYEGVPYVILEALQYGVPIVVSRVGGIPEVIEDGVNGVLVKYNDHDAWFKAIVDLWNNKPTREYFKACNLASLGIFDRERMVKETVDVLKSVLK